MDKFGVPRKINRHVIKALYELSHEGDQNSNFSNIIDAVQYTMRNNVPVENLQNSVQQSLKNLCKLGVIRKEGRTHYKFSEYEDSLPPFPSNRVSTQIFKRSVEVKEEKGNLNPNNRKRRNSSEDSLSDDDITNSIKILRTSKTLRRKGREVYLPKVRVHSDSLLHQALSLKSLNKYHDEDEMENKIITSNTELRPQLGFDIVEAKIAEVLEPKPSDENMGYLHKSTEDNSNNMADLNTQNYNQICDGNLPSSHEITENKSISDEQNDDKICSQQHRNTNEEQEKHIPVLDTKSNSFIEQPSRSNNQVNEDLSEKSND